MTETATSLIYEENLLGSVVSDNAWHLDVPEAAAAMDADLHAKWLAAKAAYGNAQGRLRAVRAELKRRGYK